MTAHAARPEPDELARFRSRPGDPAAAIRFALHVRERDPTSVWAPMTLAEHASEPEERQAMLWEAVRAGRRRWAPERRRRRVAWWDEEGTRPYMAAVYAYGHQSAALGDLEGAADSVRELMELDPEDRLGVETMARRMGVIPEVEAERAGALRM